MNLSENIKSIREEKRISQSELAKRLGVEPTNYPRLEKRGNSLTYEYIELFAKALEVSVLDLLRATDESVENLDFEKLKRENADLKFKIEDLEDDKRRLKNEVKEYESLIFDSNMEISGVNLFMSVYIIGEFQNLMGLFLEKDKDNENGYTDYTASRIKEKFIHLISLDETLPLVNLIYNNNKLLKSAITQEDGRIDMALFRKEYNELLKNYKDESKTRFVPL